MIDSAFIDRADIKQYIGLPPPEANHWILTGCLNEMMKRGLMENIVSRTAKHRPSSTPVLCCCGTDTLFVLAEPVGLEDVRQGTGKACQAVQLGTRPTSESSASQDLGGLSGESSLLALCGLNQLGDDCSQETLSQGMSGRTLRRLPVLSYARYMVSLSLSHPAFDDPEADDGAPDRPGYAVEDWLDALERVVKDEGAQKEALERLVGTGGV
jgi:hypothetical protein